MTVGRSDGRTVGTAAFVACFVLTAIPPDRLSAQVSVHLAAGVRYSSTLVHDSIVAPFNLRPALAPALLVSVRDELRPRWSVDATLDVTPSGLRRHESGGSFDAGSFTAFAFTIGLRHQVATGVTTRLGVGGLKYAADPTGVFRQGSGGVFPLAALMATYAPSLGGTFHRLEIEARYDVHRFSTPALRGVGFTGPRPVHRFTVGVSARVFGGAS
jgi:hypothetical protein